LSPPASSRATRSSSRPVRRNRFGSPSSALATTLVNPSPLGGAERVGLYTALLADGTLFYYLTVVPDADAQAFQEIFRKVGDSIRLIEVRQGTASHAGERVPTVARRARVSCLWRRIGGDN
jgi:hypothetical protein